MFFLVVLFSKGILSYVNDNKVIKKKKMLRILNIKDMSFVRVPISNKTQSP
jgi:hypothetical protein